MKTPRHKLDREDLDRARAIYREYLSTGKHEALAQLALNKYGHQLLNKEEK